MVASALGPRQPSPRRHWDRARTARLAGAWARPSSRRQHPLGPRCGRLGL